MSNNSLNRKFTEILEKMDEKVLQAKLNAALDMLKKGDMDELKKKINKIDKDELMKKIDEFDINQLKKLNINKEEIRQKVSDKDFDNLAKLLGERGGEIIEKIKDIIR